MDGAESDEEDDSEESMSEDDSVSVSEDTSEDDSEEDESASLLELVRVTAGGLAEDKVDFAKLVEETELWRLASEVFFVRLLNLWRGTGMVYQYGT